METIKATSKAYVDMILTGPIGEPLIVSFYDRSAQIVRSVGASLLLDGVFTYQNRVMKNPAKFSVYYSPMIRGKERYMHGIAIAKNIASSYLVTTKEDVQEDLYYYLMNNYDLPLMKEWMPEITGQMNSLRYMFSGYGIRKIGNVERKLRKNGKSISFAELQIYSISMKEDQLKELLSDLLRKKKIFITPISQKRLQIDTMDDYFKNYGKSIVNNLEKILKPVSDFNGEIDRICLNTMRLYPQQAAMVNGVYEYLRNKRHGYVFFAMGTGSGKTIQAASSAEMLYVAKWLDSHPGKTLADAYQMDGIINYRHIIMCPGHLVEKWRTELLKEIPYAKPVIIDNFLQLVNIRMSGKERRDGKEYYILSKDFLKLSYQRIPTPKKVGSKYVYFFKCMDCQTILRKKNDICSCCGGKKIAIVRSHKKRKGLICPRCNRLMYRQDFEFDMEKFVDLRDPSTQPLQWYHMATERTWNQKCIYCGESLWAPFVKNIDVTGVNSSKKIVWIRQTFWANKSQKGKNTYWVLKGHEAEARTLFGDPLNTLDESAGGCRKYSPALYIKKYLKGYFDVFIADEVHKAKGGSSAQGNAFHQIVKSCRYTFGLTGTIAGGVATDLFYLLFRLDPGRMIQHGYEWSGVMKFAKEYGCVEQAYLPNVDERRNKFSRGKQMTPPRVLPGISPKVFSEFLLDKAVFLDIVDMSANMPPLYEKIILCKPERQAEELMLKSYQSDINELKHYEKDNHINLMSVRNQFAMSYLDKPYGVPPILDPQNGTEILSPKNFRNLVLDGEMLTKEKRLVEIVRQELSENRNCVIYAEYSQAEETNVLPRLHSILKENLQLKNNEIIIMKANSPTSAKRERWMHEKAKEGMKVMLCNPRLCETGLDFCWKEDEKIYNYPTLIFYQCGYSLYVIWQAAGRSWRLNQREECRTFYLAYERTVQQAILQVLGEKKAATSAIQGKFSADGLAAMAQGVDTQMRIAQIMSEMDKDSVNKLQEMFDVLSGGEGTYGDYKRMKLFNELVKTAQEFPEDEKNPFKIFGLKSLFQDFDKEDEDDPEKEIHSFFYQMFDDESREDDQHGKAIFFFSEKLSRLAKENQNIEKSVRSKKKKRKEKINGDCSLQW